ncbi:EAL domain-containing protein [Vibrio sp. SCSIO 43137]|uniref:EAL domain-containing protein n=1 Tax=Vibrio sp. SCSIO 43137 TaxID=3021011 RepID=UPI002306EA6F|nr:EAL domain-containing protein [Vibrio sp. SCSIO 43137]WCE28713.1 EAL domain-containing protein [Vibrio sp. SCSIO 43137]
MEISQSTIDRLISLFDNANEGLWIADTAGSIVFYNQSFYQQFGLAINDAQLSDWVERVHPSDKEDFKHLLDHYAKGGDLNKRIVNQYRVLREDGSFCWIEATGVVKKDGDHYYMVGNHIDITEQKKMEAYVHNLAYYDKASGLPNHAKLIEDLDALQCNSTLIHIHLDKIKSYINRYGDAVIEEIVEQMVTCLSVFEQFKCECYRNSTDSFSVLITGRISDEDLAQSLQSFVALFHSLSNQSRQLYAGEVYVGAFQHLAGSKSATDVFSWASKTCEYAYRHEPARWAICNATNKVKVEHFFYIESELRRAIESKDISIRLQPITCAKTNSLLSFEALARWERSDIGKIYPDEFIPVAERQGLISHLGESVLQQACQFIQQYNNKWGSDVRINVNVSALQLLDGLFPGRARDIVKSTGVDPKMVVLELTESVLIDNQHHARSQMEQLKAIGFTLAMDDFGAGYSSLTSFFKLPFDQVKIDKELANEVMRANEPLHYMKFLTKICSDKSVSITVEGIETVDMLQIFNQMDVSTLQGYLMSSPLLAEDAFELSTDFNIWLSEKRA